MILVRVRVAVLGLGLLCGCGAWTRVELVSDTTLAPRQQVQVWRGSHKRLLHAVRLKGDSLVGVPFQRPPSCDSCRVAIPRSEVDSLRLGSMEGAGMAMSAVPFILLAMLGIAMSGMRD